MTDIHQAIDGVKGAIQNISNNLVDCNPEMRIRMLKLQDCLKVALEVLEKQIPQKTVEKGPGSTLGNCPNCNTGIGPFRSKHCSECGQKLLWDD